MCAGGNEGSSSTDYGCNCGICWLYPWSETFKHQVFEMTLYVARGISCLIALGGNLYQELYYYNLCNHLSNNLFGLPRGAVSFPFGMQAIETAEHIIEV